MSVAPWGVLRPGDHVCSMFDDEDARLQEAVQLVLDGIAQHQKIFYCAERAALSTVVPAFEHDGVDVAASLRTRQLNLTDPADSFLTEGRFDQDACIARWRRACEIARAEGYTGLRFVTDMTWAVGTPTGVADLAAYEDGMNRLFAEGYALAVCQYDVRQFSRKALYPLQIAHPATTRAGIYDQSSPLLRIRRNSGQRLELDGEIDLSNRSAVNTCLADLCDDAAALGQSATVDVTDLRFADGAVAGMFVQAAASVPAGVTIAGCSPYLMWLMLALGGAPVPNLRYSTGR